MKKTTLQMIALAFGFSMLIPAMANTEIVDGITWTFAISDGKASVGTGGFGSSAIPRNTIGRIEIPTTLGSCPVTSIGYAAFHECREITELVVPPSVSTIEMYAFSGCSKLRNVNIPSGVTRLASCTFNECRSLSELLLPNSLERIDSSAFFYGSSGMTVGRFVPHKFI